MAKASKVSGDIQSVLEDFAAQISEIVKRDAQAQIEWALASIGGKASARPGSGRRAAAAASTGPRRRGRPSKYTPEELEQLGATILAHLKKNPGARGEQISAALETDTKSIRIPLKALLQAKKIKTKGQRRGMSYFVR